MAAIVKVGTPSPCSTAPAKDKLPGGYGTGAAIAAGDILSLHTDGLIYPATPGLVRAGVAAAGSDPNGEPVTPTTGLRFFYGAGLTPGTPLYLSATVPGGLDTTLPAGDCSVAFVVDATRIQFYEKLNP